MKHYILHLKDGGVFIMQTDNNPADEMAKFPDNLKAQLSGTYREVDPKDLPKDRSQRNKWTDDGVKVKVKE